MCAEVKEWFLCCNKVKKEYFESDKVTNIKHTGSGPGALEIALNKKYNKILIIGLDHNYKWMKKNDRSINVFHQTHCFFLIKKALR